MSSLLRLWRPRATLLYLLLSLVAGGCGPRQLPEPADPALDARIQEDVAARFAAEPSLKGETIRVEVRGRIVLLRGSVKGIGAWQCAIANAELVPGVSSVVDYLVIERGERDVRCLAPRPDPIPMSGTSPQQP